MFDFLNEFSYVQLKQDAWMRWSGMLTVASDAILYAFRNKGLSVDYWCMTQPGPSCSMHGQLVLTTIDTSWPMVSGNHGMSNWPQGERQTWLDATLA